MPNFDAKVSRRSILKGALLLTGAAVGSGLLIGPASAKVPKSAMQYRARPDAGQDCSTCVQFNSGGSPKAMGTCKLVQGAISPQGYCLAYSRI